MGMISKRVALRYRLAKEFPTPEKLREYLRDHPDADPKNHSVKRLPRLQENAGEAPTLKDIALKGGRAVKEISGLKSKVDKAKNPKERRALVKDMAEQGSKLIGQAKRLLETLSGDKAKELKQALDEVEDAVQVGRKRSEDADSSHATLAGDATSIARYSEKLHKLLG